MTTHTAKTNDQRINDLYEWWENYTGKTEEPLTEEEIKEKERIQKEADRRKNMRIEDLVLKLVEGAVKVPGIKESYAEELMNLKKTYKGEALNTMVVKIQTQEKETLDKLFEGMDDEIRFAAEVLKERVENCYTKPITSEIMLQIDALSQIDVTESELRLYLQQYKGIPLALKRLAKIAETQELKTQVNTLDDYMSAVIKIIRDMKSLVNNARNGNITGLLVSKNLLITKCTEFTKFMETLINPTNRSNKVGNLREDYLHNQMEDARNSPSDFHSEFISRVDTLLHKENGENVM